MTTHQKHPRFLEDQRVFFDELITHDWATYLDPRWDAVRQFEVERIFERVSGERVLDVGCGCGYHDVLMAGARGVKDVLGIDYSPRSVETAERVYPHPRVRRQVAEIEQMDAAGAFDIAISFQVIEHVVDPAAFLRHCARQVRPGGYVIALTPNRDRLVNRVLGLLGRGPLLEDPQHFSEYTPAELHAIGESVGLECLHRLCFGYGLQVPIPKTGWSLVPRKVSHKVGYLLPSLADRFAIFFRRGTDESNRAMSSVVPRRR